jgi:hypothetical protein
MPFDCSPASNRAQGDEEETEGDHQGVDPVHLEAAAPGQHGVQHADEDEGDAKQLDGGAFSRRAFRLTGRAPSSRPMAAKF